MVIVSFVCLFNRKEQIVAEGEVGGPDPVRGEIFPDAVQYFAAGFLSHLVIDLLNRKRVHLFYPLGRGVCLNLCSSRGLVNRILFLSGGLASILLVLTALPIREALSALLAG